LLNTGSHEAIVLAKPHLFKAKAKLGNIPIVRLTDKALIAKTYRLVTFIKD
jgi:hypothetical protein